MLRSQSCERPPQSLVVRTKQRPTVNELANSAAFAWLMHADQLRLIDLLQLLLLLLRRPAPPRVWLQLLRLSGFERTLQRGNDPDIQHPFFAIGLRMLIVENAVGEVLELAAKLIGGCKTLLGLLFGLADRHGVFEATGHGVRG